MAPLVGPIETTTTTRERLRPILRGLLIGTFYVLGAAVTLFVLVKLGPVAYGLPAPFLRRVVTPEPAAV